jgi:hypothetical protein
MFVAADRLTRLERARRDWDTVHDIETGKTLGDFDTAGKLCRHYCLRYHERPHALLRSSFIAITR